MPDVKKEKVTMEAGKVSFEGTSENKNYKLDLELFKEIDPEVRSPFHFAPILPCTNQKSKYVVQPRSVQFLIEKKESGPYWDRLLKQGGITIVA